MPWGDLNPRQQAYLCAVYEVDRAKEANIKLLGAQGCWVNQPASEWRWMPYNAAGAPLLGKAKAAGYRDPGTGSTFDALERRGLVLCKYERDVLGIPILFVQITRAGRKMVREALGVQPVRKLPVGTLKEWHWKALVMAYVAGVKGVRSESGEYGGIWWRTWLRLRDYVVRGEARSLVEETRFEDSARWIGESQYQGYETRICITEFGRGYYLENWQRYRGLYPDVEAPAPPAAR